MDEYTRLCTCRDFIRSKTGFVPSVAIVLGSGLGALASEVRTVFSCSYADIPTFPVSTVAGHAGQMILGFLEDTPVLLLQGRVHYYEGYSMADAVLPVRLAGLLGAKTLLLTNAAGGINRDFSAGSLMLLTDHIATLVPSPLRGANIDKLGTRFPDMSEVYDKTCRDTLLSIAADRGILLQSGVYIQVPGPQYETPAEIRMLRVWGADAVGMSTACEAIAAHHMGLRVCGISCITNMAAGINRTPLSHAEVQKSAAIAADAFQSLVKSAVRSFGTAKL